MLDPYSSNPVELHDDFTCVASHEGGVVVDFSANNQRSGTILGLYADSLKDGSAMVIRNSGKNLTTGSLLVLESGATSPENGLLRLPANSVKEGRVLAVEAKGLVGGKAVSIVGGNLGTKSTGALLHIDSSASNGKAVEIIGPSELGSGKLLDIFV